MTEKKQPSLPQKTPVNKDRNVTNVQKVLVKGRRIPVPKADPAKHYYDVNDFNLFISPNGDVNCNVIIKGNNARHDDKEDENRKRISKLKIKFKFKDEHGLMHESDRLRVKMFNKKERPNELAFSVPAFLCGNTKKISFTMSPNVHKSSHRD